MSPAENEIELPSGRNDRPWELRLQRLGWLLFFLLGVAALCGLFGRGFFSNTTARSPSGSLVVEYQRFQRYHGPTEFMIHLGAGAVKEGAIRVWLSQSLMDQLELESVQPEPSETALSSEGCVLAFDAANLAGKTQVIIRYLPDTHFGWVEGVIGVESSDSAEVSFFVYP